MTLVQTSHTPHPVLGVTVSTLCAATSLFALLLLIYSTIDQTRPVTLLEAIHDTTVAARARQARWLARTAPPTEADATSAPRCGATAAATSPACI